MLKIIFRTAMILAAAGIVIGLLFVYSNANASSLTAGDNHSLPAGAGNSRPAKGPKPATADGFAGRDGLGGGEGGFSWFSASGLFTQAGKVGLITLMVVGIQQVFKLLRRMRRRPDAQPQAV